MKSLSENVLKNTDSEAEEKLKADVKHLEDEWEEINKLLNDTEDTLLRCVTSWDSFSTVLNALKSWEDSTSAKVSMFCAK